MTIMEERNDFLKFSEIISKDLELERMQKDIEYFGHLNRYTGSMEGEQAAEYIAGRMDSLDVLAQMSKTCHVPVDYLLFGSPVSLESQNQETFDSLCRKYPPQEIERALKLAEYYLKLEKEEKKEILAVHR